MAWTTRLGLVAVLATAAVGIVSLAGCDTKSCWPEPGEQLPGWAYDAPFYYQPTAEQEVLANEVSGEEVVPCYYTNQLVVSIKRPDTSPANCTPRLAVYYSNDGGCCWHKAGYFGLDQNFFSFVAPCEGTYRIRFVGPGMEPVRQWNCIVPHRVYVIDRTGPCVIVQVNPPKECYQPGEAINLSWHVADANIDPQAKVTLYEIASPTKIRVVGTDFGKDDTAGVIVPAEAANGVRFAVEARDKAGNVGRGFSFLIRTPSANNAATERIESQVNKVAVPVEGPMYGPTPRRPAEPEDEPARTENPPQVPAPAPTTPQTPPAGAGDGPARTDGPARQDNPARTETPTPRNNIDRTPAVQPPPINVDPNLKVPDATDPADRVIDPNYRPKLYPTTQRE